METSPIESCVSLKDLSNEELEREYLKKVSELYHAFDTPKVSKKIKERVFEIIDERNARKKLKF